jgi:single-stranded-DNA-specific exonuclease
MKIVERAFAEADRRTLLDSGMHPLLAKLYAARRIRSADELDYGAARLLAPELMKNLDSAAKLLADAIAARKRLLIIADYDADGATACAVGIRALRSFGADVDYLVPDRFKLGYGLTPELVDLAALSAKSAAKGGRPDMIITVDNGIASVEGVARAKALGIATLITDHHLPGAELPQADCIVNPNQPGCGFPSKALAGVGVMFYVALALRIELRRRDFFKNRAEPNLGALTDLVALGTVADVVPLDANNRNLVAQGLKRLREGRGKAGLAALLRAAGRPIAEASSFDLGFIMGPRLNAAGRLADMSVGIECLITDDEARAANIAQELDRLNRERRRIEAGMLEQALLFIKDIPDEKAGSSFFNPDWHQGVVGIVASRLKDRLHRPVICFAKGMEAGSDGARAVLKGSGRSIAGLHLRDCLDLVAKRAPGLILRFGGHAMAAGLTIGHDDYERFAAAFESALDEMLPPDARLRTVETDGSLDAPHFTLEVARMLEAQIWGQGFPQPLFCDTFDVETRRVVGERHLKLLLKKEGRRYEAMCFNALESEASARGQQTRIRAAYRLGVNEFNGLKNVQINVEHFE